MSKYEDIVKINAQRCYTDASQTISDEVFDAIQESTVIAVAKRGEIVSHR